MVRFVFILLSVLCFSNTLAQTFTIRITPEAGFDVIDSIYNEFQQNLPQSVLTILNEHQPADIDYLIQNRPTGHLLQLMIDNPDWSAAQLARYMLIKFPYPVDVREVKENFDNHWALEYVSYDFVENPVTFTPESPVSSNNVKMNLAFLAGNCETPSTTENGLSHYIEINGDNINLYVVVRFHFPSQPVICELPNNQIDYDLGQLPPNDYEINIYNVYDSNTFPVANEDRYLIGKTELTVRGTPAIQVPVAGIYTWALLAILMLIMANTRAPRKSA